MPTIFSVFNSQVSSFSIEDPQDYRDWVKFWTSGTTKEWFSLKGYRLYDDISSFGTFEAYRPITPSDEVPASESSYPYAYHNKHAETNTAMGGHRYGSRIFYAQDSKSRHVVIKFLPSDSDEYRILRLIHETDMNSLEKACVLPVLDLLQLGNHWLSVTPRWQEVSPKLHLQTLRNALNLMHSMLKGVKFLHDRRIFHHDVKLANMVLNFCSNDQLNLATNPLYISVQEYGRLQYAMIDYDISVIFPENQVKYRLPYNESFAGSFFISDTAQGEFEYDPFAFEVGALGATFSSHITPYIPVIPMFAPLIDKMITRNIRDRFTAPEALQFFEQMQSQLTEAQLSTPFSDNEDSLTYETRDHWKGLPDDFVKQWAHYKAPPLPLFAKILRYLINPHPRLDATIVFIRKWLFFLKTGQVPSRRAKIYPPCRHNMRI
ncbi:hypothetical protein BDQ17DRAFT_1427171 [Cyathus striatus]|nr:hypothetical protein BDQ17DRAFT_1427171 [Cyathus striatus]